MLVAFSALVLTLHWLTFFYAIQLSSVAIGLIGFATYPIFVTFFEPLINKQSFRGVDIGSMLLVVLGLLVLALDLELNTSTSALQGLFWAVVSGALNAVFTLVNRKLVQNINSFNLVLQQQVGVALLLLPWAFLNLEALDAHTAALLGVLGVLFTAIPQVLSIQSLTCLKAQFVSIVTCMEPVYSIALAALLLNEIPTLQTLAGAALVLLAVAISVKFSGRD